jgi:hypothetical protein
MFCYEFKSIPLELSFPSKDGKGSICWWWGIGFWSIYVCCEFKSIPLEWSFPSKEGLFHLLVVGHWIWIWSIHECCEFKSIPLGWGLHYPIHRWCVVWWWGLVFQMKKSTIMLPFPYLPINVLVNLFANLVKIKVPHVSGSLVKLSEIKILCELYCFFHIYLSMCCWSIFLQIWIRSRFHVLVGLLWNWVRSKFLVNCIAFFISTYRCVGQSFCKFE